MDKIRKQLDILAKNGTTFHENALGIFDEKSLKCPHCGSDKIFNVEDIKNKLDEILSLYDKDDYRCGGYSMTKYSHITAPEDYIESRIDWNTLQSRADDMYYMLSDIKTIIEQCKKLL